MRLFPAVGVAAFAVPAFAHAVFKVVIELFVRLPLDDPGTGDLDLAAAPAPILRINRVAVAVRGIGGVRLRRAPFADARALGVAVFCALCIAGRGVRCSSFPSAPAG